MKLGTIGSHQGPRWLQIHVFDFHLTLAQTTPPKSINKSKYWWIDSLITKFKSISKRQEGITSVLKFIKSYRKKFKTEKFYVKFETKYEEYRNRKEINKRTKLTSINAGSYYKGILVNIKYSYNFAYPCKLTML